LWRLVSNFIQTPSVNERIVPGSSRHLQVDSVPKHVGANGGVSCTIHNATVMMRQTVCWRLKKHANLITANFVSLWPPHGSRSPKHEAMDIMLARWDTAERRISVGR